MTATSDWISDLLIKLIEGYNFNSTQMDLMGGGTFACEDILKRYLGLIDLLAHKACLSLRFDPNWGSHK